MLGLLSPPKSDLRFEEEKVAINRKVLTCSVAQTLVRKKCLVSFSIKLVN